MQTLREYWQERARASTQETYKGRHMAKMPEDLMLYQHVIWDTKPEVIVELGTFHGGSAMWFADQLSVLVGTATHVVTVDNTPREAVSDPAVIQVVGDLTQREVFDEVEEEVNGRRAMLVEDSAHDFETTLSALQTYGPLVAESCYFVVEDTIVEDEENCPPEWYKPGSVGKAIDEFLKEESGWVRESRGRYIVTMHAGGWLRRT